VPTANDTELYEAINEEFPQDDDDDDDVTLEGQPINEGNLVPVKRKVFNICT
jgi:hypothetical protein